MRKSLIFVFIFVFILVHAPVPALASSSGSLVKASGSAVYYLLDGKRYVFPNERVYFSWYPDFGAVRTISDMELASYRLGGNVTYRPGVRLVKIRTDSKTYAVSKGGVLRWITSEDVARMLYGEDWNKQVHDIADAYFLNYRVGDPIEIPEEFDVLMESAIAGIFEDITARTVSTPESSAVLASIPSTNSVRAIVSGQWSDPKTWNTSGIPKAGAEVFIPRGVTVTYAMKDPVPMKSITIDGRLTIESDANTVLMAKMIVVGGSMSVGTSDNPIPSTREAKIILTGSSPFGISDDGLLVNGSLDIHGMGRAVPWTTLSEVAQAGATTITLSKEVDWLEGEEILIATGSANASETERRRILSVNGATLTLDAPLDFTHRSDEYRRSEVASLARNVRIVGAGEGKGSRIVVGTRGNLRIHGATLEGLGRKGVSGHHPVYFDATGTSNESYVRNSVIDRSGNGCIVLKQTNSVTIENVVATEIEGSCHVAVDGATDAVSYENDLVVSLFGDTSSGFLIRNPSTILEGNAVVGAPAHGFRYDLPESATRSDGKLIRPREEALANFFNNGAYANGGNGLFVGGNGTGDYSPRVTAVFSGFDAVFNAGYGFKMHGANLMVKDAHLIANTVGGSFSAFVADFIDSTVVGFPDDPVFETASNTADIGNGPGRFGFVFTDGPVSVNGVTFRNFISKVGTPSAAFSFESSNPRVPDARNNYRDVTFESAQKWFVYPPKATGDYLAVVRDLDANEVVASSDPFLDYACLQSVGHIMTCRGNFSQLSVIFRGASDSHPVRFVRLDTGATFILYPGEAFDGQYAYMTVPEGPSYLIEGPATRNVFIDWSEGSSAILLQLPSATSPSVRIDGGAVRVASNPNPGEYAYDPVGESVLIHLPAGATADITW